MDKEKKKRERLEERREKRIEKRKNNFIFNFRVIVLVIMYQTTEYYMKCIAISLRALMYVVNNISILILLLILK